MKRGIIAALMLVGTTAGCMSTNDPPETGGMRANYGQSFGPRAVPGVRGAYGEDVPMAAPYAGSPPGSDYAARMMMRNTMPMNMMQMHPSGMMTPPGMPPMPGMMPGMPGMPGPGGMPGGMPNMMPGGNPLQKTSLTGFLPDAGVMNANVPPGGIPSGVKPAQFASSPTGPQFPAQRTQVFFPKPAGMKIFWYTQGPDGKPSYSTTPLETPGRYNFAQAAIYRLKLTHIPGRPALELYPTLEVVPTGPKTNEFLAHNSVPVEFTDEDFKQVVDRNYIVKVIYLPDPQFQDAAGAGPDEIVSTRLEPGQDPIQEALRRGSILLVLRIGNIDQGLQHSPPMTAPTPGGPPVPMKPVDQGVPGLFQKPFPTTPIVPGGVAPNALPPFPGLTPPNVAPNVKPELKPLDIPPPLKPEIKIDPKKDENKKPAIEPKKDAEKVGVPALDLPPPPGLKLDPGANPGLPLLPPPPAPLNQNDKGANNAPTIPSPPVVPASSGPSLPSIDPTLPARPDLPGIPTLPPVGGRK